MIMRTKKAIESEIRNLKACKSYIPCTGACGDNNHRNLDLQIECLRDGTDDNAEKWNDYAAPEWSKYTESEQRAILESKYWKDGDSDESPSSGWDQYKPSA